MNKTNVGVLFFSVVFCAYSSAKTTVQFATFMLHEKHRSYYEQLIESFETKHADIDVSMNVIRGETYQELLQNLLTQHSTVDVISWHGGKRLEHLSKLKLVAPIDDLWREKSFAESFNENGKKLVRFDEHYYGVPLSYNPWGFFYNQSLFIKLGLAEPKTWQELLTLMLTLKKNNLQAIAIATKMPWPIAAWFDYITLRLHGYDFYHRLTQGEISYTSEEVKAVFKIWKEVVDADYYLQGHKNVDSHRTLHFVSREVAGITLASSSSLSYLDKKHQQGIGFFPFPVFSNDNDKTEIATTSVYSLMSQSKDKVAAKKFIRFLAQPDVQNKLAVLNSTLPANLYSDSPLKEQAKMLNAASHLTQYFDRESHPDMVAFCEKVFAEFIEHGDIDKTLIKLEQRRQLVFNPQKIH